MSSRRKILVRNVYNPKKMHSVVVGEEDSIRAIIRRFARQPSLRGIFVVNKQKNFKGVISRLDLLKWTKIELGRGKVFGAGGVSVGDLARHSASTVARDLIPGYGSRAYVEPDDGIDRALTMMVAFDLIDVPVVERGKIVGDVKLTEILSKILQRAH